MENINPKIIREVIENTTEFIKAEIKLNLTKLCDCDCGSPHHIYELMMSISMSIFSLSLITYSTLTNRPIHELLEESSSFIKNLMSELR
jgi:hypothetical protein